MGRLDLWARYANQITRTDTSRPDRPTNLRFETDANGVRRLAWNAPAAGAPVSLYRVYRNGVNLAERFNNTVYDSGDRFVEIPGGSATYRVTAVAPSMTESAMSEALIGP
jgi:hypothetical protein